MVLNDDVTMEISSVETRMFHDRAKPEPTGYQFYSAHRSGLRHVVSGGHAHHTCISICCHENMVMSVLFVIPKTI